MLRQSPRQRTTIGQRLPLASEASTPLCSWCSMLYARGGPDTGGSEDLINGMLPAAQHGQCHSGL